MEINMGKVFLGIFPPAGGTFESFDRDELERMIKHLSRIITYSTFCENVRVTVFAQDEETISEEQREEGLPLHRIFPSLQEVRKYREDFPCHIDAWYIRGGADMYAEACRYVRAQGGCGLIRLKEWQTFSAFELTCHMTRHMRINANDSTTFLTTVTGRAEKNVATV